MSKRQFEKFYNKHLDKVYRFVFFRVNAKKDVAEDLVSGIFLKALKNFENYDINKSISAWIMTIARNHLANYWRDKKETVALMTERQNNFEDGVITETATDLTWQVNNKDGLRQAEIARELDILLQNLNDNEREIVTLHYISGYSYTEIGEMKDMTETAVKVIAHRALKKMKNLIRL